MNAVTNFETLSQPAVKLYFFEFCSNNQGLWDREWFLTREEADAARTAMADTLDTDLEAQGELCGEYGDICEVEEHDVVLSADGILAFAKSYAVDNGN